jgi:hypothetical protein
LRAGGIRLVTLAEHYGQPTDQDVEDVTWISDAAMRGWILFMKDARIKHRPAERQAVLDSGARCFCLSDGNILATTMADRYLINWEAIVDTSGQPGPFVYSVRASGIVRLNIS